MFCENCGKKAKKGDLFCEKCGTKLNVEEETEKEEVVEHKPMDKATKNKLIIVSVIVVALLIGNFFIKKSFSPEKMAENYFDATVKNDLDKLYDFYDIENKGLTSKKIFKKIKSNKDVKVPEITNYTIKDAVYEDMNMKAIVEITYHQKGINDNKTLNVYLYKDKKKKFLFYDNWRVEANLNDIINDYQIKVPKNTEVLVENINVSKYLDKKLSNDNIDVYKFDELFKGKYEIETIYPGKLKNKEEVNINYSTIYRPRLNVETLSKETVENLEKKFSDEITNIYKHIIDKKEFKDIKKDYEVDGLSLDDFEKSYDYLYRNLVKETRSLKKLEVEDVDISNIYINDSGEISFYLNTKYNYSIDYKVLDEIKTNNDKSTDSLTLVYKVVDDKFRLVNAKNLSSYFSIY